MKLNVKRTFLVGLAFLLISMFWQIYDGVMSIVLVNNFGLNQTWSGILLALDNLLALALLPLFGAWSDKTSTKMGKRKPYVLIGTIVAAIVFVSLAVVDFYQFQAVRAEEISPMLSILNGNGDVIGYYFTVGGNIKDIILLEGNSYGFVYITQVADKVAELRAAYIFAEITQPNWIYLASFIVILFIVLIAMCSFRTPAVSLMPDVTIKPLRSKANAIINAMGTIGGGISLVLIMVVGTVKVSNYDTFNYLYLFGIVAGLMLAFLAIFMFLVKEVKWTDEMRRESLRLGLETEEDEKVAKGTKGEKMEPAVRRSFILILLSVFLWFFAYNAASSKLSLYAQNILQIENYTFPAMIGFGAALIAFYPIGILSTKFGRRNMILVGIGVLILGFILAFIASIDLSFGWVIYAAMVVVGFGWAAINVNSYPMVVEMSKGPNIGVFTGYYYAASMLAQALTPVISGLLMDAFGMTLTLFPYAIFFSIAAAVTMFFVKHGESKRLETKEIQPKTE
ncbi:MAG TPA: MFS transporter [Bacilli bacterium]|nr:MFS transporter [Bacilli bacterium]HOR20313.1 MFS transporter [Bacilli bacterium]HPK67253.1 MFS transporter [Bacilli bacterium]